MREQLLAEVNRALALRRADQTGEAAEDNNETAAA
jgi:hypothetical protein